MKIPSIILILLCLSVGICKTALGGGLLVANPNDITITQVDLNTGVSSVMLSESDGLTRPAELTLDASGNLYFANVGSYDIYRYSTTGVLTKYYDSLGASVSAGIHGIDFDSNGLLHIGFSGGRIEKYNEGTGSLEPFATVGQIESIEFDSLGDLYVADPNFSTGNGRIQKVDSSGNFSIFATGLTNPRDLNIDGSNRLYVHIEYRTPVWNFLISPVTQRICWGHFHPQTSGGLRQTAKVTSTFWMRMETFATGTLREVEVLSVLIQVPLLQSRWFTLPMRSPLATLQYPNHPLLSQWAC